MYRGVNSFDVMNGSTKPNDKKAKADMKHITLTARKVWVCEEGRVFRLARFVTIDLP